MKKRILLIGTMGSGKTYLAEWLRQNHDFNIISLAQPIKEYFEIAYGRKPDKTLEEDRVALQNIGKGMRQVDTDFWCDIADRKLHPRAARFVIPDCRFLNETKYFDDFYKIKLEVSPAIRRARLIKRDGQVFENTMNDESETELEKITPDVIINMDTEGVPQEFIDIFNN